jgi:tetratricopeptide (TPR) repeat protein
VLPFENLSGDADQEYFAAEAHDVYSKFLVWVGRFDEASDEVNTILEIDPLSPTYRRYPAWLHYFARRHDQSIAELQKLPGTRDPDSTPEWRAWPWGFLALNYAATGRYEEALAATREVTSLLPPGKHLWEDLLVACVYATAGRRDEAERILSDYRAKSRREELDPLAMAALRGALGDKDEAFEWLNYGYKERCPGMIWVKVLPELDRLRSDPRFGDLLRRMNFPE